MEGTDETEQETKNKATVIELYKAVDRGDARKVAGLLASDLEWWFHGPQKCHHMMKVLTGAASHTEFRFTPKSITPIGDRIVIAEGYEGHDVYWVHVWALQDGLITQFREYFNTWLTVKELRPGGWPLGWVVNERSTVWRSQPRDLFRRSLPGLMLAI